ncbi:hypothetical protein Tco_0540408 [Tanacetum coccineum]
MLHDLDQQMEKRADDGCTLWIKLHSKYEYEIRYHPGKANVVIDALRRKERVKPRRVRAMVMTIKYGVRGMILASQSKAFKKENGMIRTVVMNEVHASRYLVHLGADKTYYNLGDMYCLRYLSENEIESPWILSLNFQDNSKEWNSGDDQLRLRWMIYLVVLADAAESVRDTIGFEYCLASSSGWTKSPVLWAEIGESSLTGPELVLDMTDKVVLIKEKLKAARDRQKSYADNRRKPLEFEVGDRVMLKVSPWKGVIRFGKKGKLAPSLHVPLDEIKVDKTLRFVEEPVENSDREVKRFLTSLLDDGRGSGSWMFLFVWSGYAAMRTLLWAGKVLDSWARSIPYCVADYNIVWYCGSLISKQGVTWQGMEILVMINSDLEYDLHCGFGRITLPESVSDAIDMRTALKHPQAMDKGEVQVTVGCFSFRLERLLLAGDPLICRAKVLAVRYLVKVDWNSKLDNQSIERDRLNGIGFVLDFVEFISFTFGDKEMISVIEAIPICKTRCDGGEIHGAKIEQVAMNIP